MAVIIIPSKHIYFIDNQKVIDNQIDKVEVDATIVSPNNEYNAPVYNEGVDITNKKLETGTEQQPSMEAYTWSKQPDGFLPISFALAYFRQPKYISIDVQIPISQYNKFISKVKDGIDKNDNSFIQYSLFGDIEKGFADETIYGVSWTKDSEVTYKLAKGSITIENEIYSSTDTDNGIDYQIPNYIKVNAQVSLGDYKATADTLVSEGNIKDKIFSKSQDGENYIATIKILCGITVITSTSAITPTTSLPSSFIAHCSYTKYIPNQVQITIYGNTIGIDLQDKTIAINENGSNIISFSGNELMQDTNSPTIEETYGKVIEQYKDGKEVATIRCGIEDYYDINGDKLIAKNGKGSKVLNELVDITIDESAGAYYYGTAEVFVGFGGGVRDLSISIISSSAGLFNKSAEYDSEKGNIICRVFGFITGLTATIKITGTLVDIPDTSMTFHIGDTVIPYVYGANGKDKPMSLKKDGTPKEFKIVGKGLIYDGAILQNLTIQEKTV